VKSFLRFVGRFFMSKTTKSPINRTLKTSTTTVNRLPDRFSVVSSAFGTVAKDPVMFRSLVDAFEAADRELFQHILKELRIEDYCERICAWLRSKEIVLECLITCGPPPKESLTFDQVAKFADIAANLSQDEFLTRRLVDAVKDRDSVAFKTVVSELGAQQLCHLLCHWISIIRYRLVCEIICGERKPQPGYVVYEVMRAAAAVAEVAKKHVLLQTAFEAAIALDIDSLSDIIRSYVHCYLICEWICSWRCLWVCMPICEPFPMPEIKDRIEEMRAFALFTEKLSQNKEAIPSLLSALQSGKSETFTALVKEYQADRFCIQLCHWLCFEICRRWCFVICLPSVPLTPWFTQVGTQLNIFNDIDSQPNLGTPVTGLAKSTSPFPNYAFFDGLQLGGQVPAYIAGNLMAYRFLLSASKTLPGITTAETLKSPISAATTSINVDSVAGFPAPPFDVVLIATGERMTVTSIVANTLTVTRGQKNTFARAANTGDIVSTLAPITKNLLYNVNDTRQIPWPVPDGSGKATASMANYPQKVIIGSSPIADVPPPTVGATWYPPQPHYLKPDDNGWVVFDNGFLNGESLAILLGFYTSNAVPGGDPLPTNTAGNPASPQRMGTDVLITFEATKATAITTNTVDPVDFSQKPTQLRVNNWSEVHQLNLQEFGVGDCCNPITSSLNVLYTVDHEEMGPGAWSINIESCDPTAPGTILSSPPPAPPTSANRGGAGTIPENTTNWSLCSYKVWLHTRPGLTNGTNARIQLDTLVTFCICSH
jgi:hypothetical protein